MSSTKPALCSGDAWHNLILSAATAQHHSFCLSNHDGFPLTSPCTRLNYGNTIVCRMSSLLFLGVNWELRHSHGAYQLKKHGNTCASYFCIVCLEFYTPPPDAGKMQWLFPTTFPTHHCATFTVESAWVRSEEARLSLRCK